MNKFLIFYVFFIHFFVEISPKWFICQFSRVTKDIYKQINFIKKQDFTFSAFITTFVT